jgi:hypothetical protein
MGVGPKVRGLVQLVGFRCIDVRVGGFVSKIKRGFMIDDKCEMERFLFFRRLCDS